MKYHTLGLMYTYKCVAECDICGFKCSPQRNEKMDIEDAKRLIHQASECNIHVLGITGGEPFLYYDEIIELAKVAKKYRMQVTITSNCYWADSYKKAVKYFLELKENGVRSIKISVDNFHNKFVSYENIKNVLKASKFVGLRVIVGCTITRNSSKLKGVLESFDEEITDIALYEHKCYPLGNAKEKFNKEELYFSSDIINDCMECGIIFATPNGDVYPCGSMCGMIPNRLVGSSYKNSLKELISKSTNNIHNKFISERGIKPYLEEIKKENYGIKINNEFVDACHACYEVFNNMEMDKLNKISERIL